MKGVLGAAIALTVLAGAAVAAGPRTADDFVELEKQRSAAIVAHDMTWLDGLYAEDFRGITSTAYQVDKKTLMTVFTRDDPNTLFTLDDVKARPVGHDGMITTGRVTGRNKAGEILSQFRFMHVYERQAGGWKLVMGSGTDLPPERREP